MSKIIIQLQGGLVQEVFFQGTGAPTKAIVVDEDIDGIDSEELTTVKTSESVYEAAIHTEKVTRLKRGTDVDLIVKKFLHP